MKIFRKQPGTPFLTIKGKKILRELKLQPFDEKIRRHKSNWLRHLIRI